MATPRYAVRGLGLWLASAAVVTACSSSDPGSEASNPEIDSGSVPDAADSNTSHDADAASVDTGDADAPNFDATDGTAPDGDASEGTDAILQDADAGDEFAPAAHPPYPAVPNHGGPVLASMELVPIYFPNEPLHAELDQFNTWIVSSQFWTAIGQEYGVGPATAHAPVDIAASPPAQLDDSDVAAWIATSASDGTIPAPNANTLYALFYPASTTITFTGAPSCSGFGGYHSHVHVSTAGYTGEVAYAVIPRCGGGTYDLVMATDTASHEYIEGATDPFYWTEPAWRLDPPNGDPLEPWTMLGGFEVSDLCENQSYDVAYAFSVQDSWSNAAALAGRNPCQPSDPNRPFYSVSSDQTTYHAVAGTMLTIHATAWSTLPTSDWTVGVNTTWAPPSDFDGAAQLSKSTVNNGDAVDITVTIPANPPQSGGRSIYRFTIDSADGTNPNFYHPWPVMVVVP
jgi:hypothetical protein